jgi:hypothetical protein
MKNITNTAVDSIESLKAQGTRLEPSSGGQLGLSLAEAKTLDIPEFRPNRHHRRRQVLRSRAAWWFQQMRRTVDAAMEWKPASLPRPEQTTLDLRRPTEVALKGS